MQDLLTADRPARAPLRVAPRTLRSPRITRIIRTFRITRTLHDMLLVAMDPTMDLEIALDIAITVGMVRDTGVGIEAYLFRVV